VTKDLAKLKLTDKKLLSTLKGASLRPETKRRTENKMWYL